jgi:uncharacterized membrane protein YfcA
MSSFLLSHGIAPGDAVTVYVIAILFIATLIRSTLGFGEALVAVPLLALSTPVTVAAPLAVLVSVVVAGVMVARDWRHIQFRSASRLVLSSLVGIPLGVLMLANVEDHLVKLILGTVIVGFSAYSIAAGSIRRLHRDHAGWLMVCGFLSGILGGAYGMNGPPLVVYGTLRGWSPQQFRATLQGYFLPASIVGLIGYASIGLFTIAVARYFLLSLPAIALAILLGRVINRMLSGDRFFRLVYGGLLLIGTVLLVQAMRG